MVSKIVICNLALAQLGQPAISGLDQDDEKARRLKLFYEPVRDEVLRTHNWAFAAAQMPLTPLENAPDGSGRQVYKYPQDALFIRRVFAAARPQERLGFEEYFRPDLQTRVLCVAAPDAVADYTRRITDENCFDPAFVKCFSLALACDLAPALTGDNALAGQLLQKYMLCLDEARRSNMSENFICADGSDAFSGVR